MRHYTLVERNTCFHGFRLPFADGKKLSSTFTFGCMESETGLFRGQIVDGIMGMSAASDTLVYKLFENKVIKTRAFGMCFRVGGGVLTLGGLDSRLNNEKMKVVAVITCCPFVS